jgi:two-component system phosphate regulon sensor histidine kinase PhoR
VLLSVLPPAVLLAVLAARGTVSFVLLVIVLGVGLVGGIVASAMVVRVLIDRREGLEVAAAELEAKRRPIRLVRGDHLVGLTEQRLVAAADAMVRDLETLAEQREELEVILRSMSEGVVVTDTHGEVMLINGAAREMLELGQEVDYRGRSLVEICREPAIQQLVAGPMGRQDSPWPGSIELSIQKSGPLRRLRVTAGQVGPSARSRAAWVLVFYDVTQLKAYEGLRSDFIANLTHEIRTPLSALCGYTETLLEGVDDPATRRRFLGIIERQSRRLARLVDDLVSLSDLERGLTPLQIQDLGVKRLFDEAVELMREPAERQGVELEIQCAEGQALAGDHDRLYQVLLNLLDNAIKYTPRGGRVTLSARALAAPNGSAKPAVEIAVADTGEGIPPQHIPRLTERFYRVDRARSRELGGTGLGLAIVKHIVQLHQGELQIESRVREGTTVRVRLPIPQAAAAGSERLPAVSSAS